MHTLKKRELPSNILRYVLLLLGGAVSVMPMIYMISTSLKPNGALYEFPPKFSRRSIPLRLKTMCTSSVRKSSTSIS